MYSGSILLHRIEQSIIYNGILAHSIRLAAMVVDRRIGAKVPGLVTIVTMLTSNFTAKNP